MSYERSPIEHGATVEEFDALADIPAFDFTRQDEPIAAVTEWRRRVAEADVVVMAAPEYAGGLAGVAKNALDWLVGSGDLYRKPVAVVTAGTSGGLHARRQLVQTLTWQGAYVVAELGIAVPRSEVEPARTDHRSRDARRNRCACRGRARGARARQCGAR